MSKNQVPFLRRLQVRLVLGFLVLAYVPMVVLSFYGYERTKRGYAEQVSQNAGEVAQRVAGRMVDVVTIADQQLGVWTAQRDAKEAPRIYGQTFNVFALLQTRFRSFLASQREVVPLFSSILSVRPAKPEDPALGNDARGAALVMFASERDKETRWILFDFWVPSPAGPTVNPRYRWLASGSHESALTASPFDPQTRVLPIAREYRDQDGGVVALVGLIDWAKILEFLGEARGRTGPQGTHLLLFDEKGVILGGALPGVTPSGGKLETLVPFLRSQERTGHAEIPGLGAVFVGKSAVAPGGWTVVAIKNAAQALEPIYGLRNGILAALGLVLVVVLFLSMQLTGRITAPLNKLVHATQSAAGGDLQHRIPIERNDEVGELAVSFNIMTEKLRESFSQLGEQNEELRRVDRLRSEFLATTSHELRTPINGILGLIESILDGAYGPVVAKQRATLDLAHQSAKRLAKLVSDILDFSAAQKGELPLTLDQVDLRALLEKELFPLLTGLTRGKDVKLELDLHPSLPVLTADKEKLRQLFMNVVGNAIKFTSKGRVTVRAKSVGGTDPKSGRISIQVADTGLGIPKSELTAIFEPFRQVKATERREHEGTGLGLAIAKQVVRRHGGRIWAESELGKGSTFFVELPLSPQETDVAAVPEVASEVTPTALFEITPPPIALPQEFLGSGELNRGEEASSRAEVRAGQGELILVVDDEPVNVEVLKSKLEMYGYKVQGVYSAMGALELLQDAEQLPDLILLDIMMPKMSGYDFAMRLKQNPEWGNIPIIMVSAKNQLVDKIYALNLGAVDYITKPFQKDELLAKVRTFLDLRALHVALESLNLRLEERVAERTSELESSLKQLAATQGKLVQAEKIAGLGAMAEGVAHELKSALSTVASSLKPLKDSIESIGNLLGDLRKPEESPPRRPDMQLVDQNMVRIQRALGGMKEGIERGESLAQDLAVLSITTRGDHRHRSIRAVDLGRLIEGSLATLAPLIRTGAEVHREFAPEGLKVHCDPGKIGRVLVHLISRALLAIEGKGEVWIRTKRTEETRVAIIIVDNGRPIPEDRLAHLFDPFYLDKSGERASLGLSIVHTFVLDHDGGIQVESKPNQGTTFTVELPMEGPAGVRHATEPPPLGPGKGVS